MAKTQKEQNAAGISTERLIGVAVPVGALRGEQSIGVGEFPDLVEFAELCITMGVELIQILPVNDTGYESSPYGSLTAFALNPLYLRIGDLGEAAGFTDKLIALKKQFDGETRFPYYKILRAKIDLLREIFAANEKDITAKAKSGGSLATWIDKNPWVKEYAVYRRLKEINGEKSWKEWKTHRTVNPEDIQVLWKDQKQQKEHLFWAWLQEALDTQFSKAAKALNKMGILLEGDLPILMNEDSCDVWAHPEYFYPELSAGAPPDMYNSEGQNWGFPTYNWQAQAKDDYAWWRQRLSIAEKYYNAYRIDHVLGFFRIWSSLRENNYDNAILGRYVPYSPITKKDLDELHFDEGRIRWISQPHVPTSEVWGALNEIQDTGAAAKEAEKIFSQVLDRIGNEELWLFKKSIKGEQDITALGLHPAPTAYLRKAWRNRLFLEYEKGKFFPVWLYRESRAYQSFSGDERNALDALLAKRLEESEKTWETQGKKLLSILVESSKMLPCAEDLGAVPDCVPKVLAKLKILGLRVIRWHREWDKPGQPYYAFEDYPELSVCTPSVHDSSTLREWWDKEADQGQFSAFLGVPSLPKVYNPGTAKTILSHAAAAASRFRVFQIQDLLHLSTKWYAEDPASERINVPGFVNEFNWTYRLPAAIKEIRKDEALIKSIQELAAVTPKKKSR
ncbi:4-alpha-glucanotransferase (Amylomaltase)(Disproportionating enzyme) (D-enzyme) [Treponema primitia ZAS-2]|uniref:4-alpha-glucanotransferase n=1 Tax=Treponema primitia (strain ATCC BAA-887 / DSM 12427 / ZAS-2) TaxID=545694 RepID=F5YLK6_TREPZ|nr:4-alpha-glucanotransferase [Treponema primitia]AEF85120.1 4-alpha-glucanotransferase (Amylomaltase)(Disproportionating enzyme) (D-enzyme) [Treponema primitia ZAS-2]